MSFFWSRFDIQFDGSRYNLGLLTPPLELVWEYPFTHQLLDGLCVGGKGCLYVPTRGVDLVALVIETGEILWEIENCRKDNETIIFCDKWLITNTENEWGSYSVAVNSNTGKVVSFKNSNGIFLKRKIIPFGIFGNYLIDFSTIFDLSSLVLDDDILPKFFNIELVIESKCLGCLLDKEGMFANFHICFDLISKSIIWKEDYGFLFGLRCANNDLAFLWEANNICRVINFIRGCEVWRRELDSLSSLDSGCTIPTMVDNRIFIELRSKVSGSLLCIDALTGCVIWSADLTPANRPSPKSQKYIPKHGPYATPGLVWTEERANAENERLCKIVARSQENGEVVWESEPENDVMIRAFVDGHMILQKGRTLQCYRSKDPQNPVGEVLRHELKKKPKKAPKIIKAR